MKRKLIYLFVITVLVIAVYFLRFLFNVPFNSEKWKNWTESESSPSERWEMIHDLKRDDRLIGKTVNEIIGLLGKPNKTEEKKFIYYLGYTGNGINTASLIVCFNNGIVSDLKVTNG